MHILYIHQHFSTRHGSTGTRSYEMAKALLQQGHRVTMVCGSYAQGTTGLTGKFRFGQRRGIVDGIEIIEFNLYYDNRMSFNQRLLAFTKFSIGSIVIALSERTDIIFASSTPLTASIPGIFAKFFRKKPFVFEVRDLWPELPRAMGIVKNPIIVSLMLALERLSYKSADRIIGLSPGIVDGISKRSVPLTKIRMIPNGCDLDLFDSIHKPWRPVAVNDEQILAIYSGTHGKANGLNALLDAAIELKLLGRKDIAIVLVGDGMEKQKLIDRSYAENIDNITFLDPMPKTQLAGLLAGADIGLQILQDIPAFYFGTSPNKFFDYIASGLPSLTNYPGWVSDLIDENNCGFSVQPNNPRDLANALIQASENRETLIKMGRNARDLAETKFNRDKLALDWMNWVLVNQKNMRSKNA
jgi:glycosyltransferase involved in cell wall biosynthesis